MSLSLEQIIKGDPQRLLKPGEVAEIVNSHPKTVAQWAKRGRIKAIRLPSGHRRIPASEIIRLMLQLKDQASEPGPTG